jgi:hypothetical protein
MDHGTGLRRAFGVHWQGPMSRFLSNRVYYSVMKTAETAAYVGLVLLTWRLLAGELHWRIAIGALVLSGGWLLLTFVRMTHLLKTYFDTFSRIEFLLPCVLGVSLAVFALVEAHLAGLRALAMGEIAGWGLLVLRYRRNRRHYERQGHGPLPAGCWVSPPAQVLQPGDLILTSGRVASSLRESVGHGETVLLTREGMASFSSYMDRGAVLHSVDEYADWVSQHGHYVVLRLREELTAERVKRAEEIAREMIDENRRWSEEANRRRQRIIEHLPLPGRTRDKILERTRSVGYDWVGLLMGRLAPHRWTCIGACLELYRRLDVETNTYGTGLLGFGTTLLDPIMPVRFFSDPAFRVLSLQDQESGAAD